MSIPQRRGRLYLKTDIDAFRNLRKKHYKPHFGHEPKHQDGARLSEVFDANLISQLLTVKGCTGLRVCYGAANEKDNKIDAEGKNVMPRLLLIPVDDNGKELTFSVVVDGEKDGGDKFGGAAGGVPCPPAAGCPQ